MRKFMYIALRYTVDNGLFCKAIINIASISGNEFAILCFSIADAPINTNKHAILTYRNRNIKVNINVKVMLIF